MFTWLRLLTTEQATTFFILSDLTLWINKWINFGSTSGNVPGSFVFVALVRNQCDYKLKFNLPQCNTDKEHVLGVLWVLLYYRKVFNAAKVAVFLLFMWDEMLLVLWPLHFIQFLCENLAIIIFYFAKSCHGNAASMLSGCVLPLHSTSLVDAFSCQAGSYDKPTYHIPRKFLSLWTDLWSNLDLAVFCVAKKTPKGCKFSPSVSVVVEWCQFLHLIPKFVNL